MKLFQIPVEASLIEEELSANYGELTPELELRISTFVQSGKDKMEAAAAIVRSLEADAEICMAEAKRLAERAGHLDHKVERLKALMLAALDFGFNGKIKTSMFTIWGQTSAPSVSFVANPQTDLIKLAEDHPEFIRKPAPELDKAALKEAYKDGAEIPQGIDVVELDGTRFLRIR